MRQNERDRVTERARVSECVCVCVWCVVHVLKPGCVCVCVCVCVLSALTLLSDGVDGSRELWVRLGRLRRYDDVGAISRAAHRDRLADTATRARDKDRAARQSPATPEDAQCDSGHAFTHTHTHTHTHGLSVKSCNIRGDGIATDSGQHEHARTSHAHPKQIQTRTRLMQHPTAAARTENFNALARQPCELQNRSGFGCSEKNLAISSYPG